MPSGKSVPMRQRSALFRVRDHETPEYGVIVEPMSTGAALIRRGLTVHAQRRSFARITGVCVRLTDAGRKFLKGME